MLFLVDFVSVPGWRRRRLRSPPSNDLAPGLDSAAQVFPCVPHFLFYARPH